MRAQTIYGVLLTASGLLGGGLGLSWAQTTAPAAAPAPGGPLVREETKMDAGTQRIQRIQVEDSGSRIDEVREGGETTSIKVQPKANVPPYDVQPADMMRPVVPEGVPGGAGQRTWKILSF